MVSPVVRWAVIAIGVSCAGLACGQGYPARPVRLVTSSPGAGTDFATRVIAQGLTAKYGRQVIVDNRPSGVVIGEIVAKSAPDGHTMFLNGSAFWLQPFLQSNTPYDPVRDFSPVTLVTTAPNVLVVNASLPANSVQDLIARAKAKPGELNYGSSSAGTPTHLGPELFKAMTGVNIVRVAYKGNGPAVNGLIMGEVQMMLANVTSVLPHVRSGRLKALAVASAEPTALAPGLPTIAASGVPGFESSSTYGVFGPAGMPRQLVDQISRDMVEVLRNAEAKQRLFNAGMEVLGTTPQELARVMKADMQKMGAVIKNAGIKADF
jgi:tripartite-type tricarboxylate transporter receptor subunit TctC